MRSLPRDDWRSSVHSSTRMTWVTQMTMTTTGRLAGKRLPDLRGRSIQSSIQTNWPPATSTGMTRVRPKPRPSIKR